MFFPPAFSKVARAFVMLSTFSNAVRPKMILRPGIFAIELAFSKCYECLDGMVEWRMEGSLRLNLM
jgi:hypothetical protein